MEVNNPYIEDIRRLYIEIEENPKDEEKKKELAELQEKSRAFIQETIEQLKNKVYVVEEKQREVEQKSNYPSINKQYKAAISVYKEIMELVEDSRELKKAIREEIQAKREAKNDNS